MSDLTSLVKLSQQTFEDHAAFFKLLRAATEIVMSGDRVLRNVDSDLTIKEFDILAYVGAFGPIRPVDLAKRTALTGSPQTLSSALNRLEQRDLVLRSPNEDDVRSVEVSITNQGLEQLHTLFPVLSKKLIEPFDIHYTDEEIAELGRLLQRL